MSFVYAGNRSSVKTIMNLRFRSIYRAVVIGLLAAQVVNGMPVFAAPTQSAATPPAVEANRSERRTINRTLPNVTPPPLEPTFSAQPTRAEIQTARIFAEPLLPVGEPTDAENRVLVAALQDYRAAHRVDAVAPLLRFLAQFPNGAWAASIHTNVATLLRDAGFYTRALNAWENAWGLTGHLDGPRARVIADRALSEMMLLRGQFGDVERLQILVDRAAGREFIGASAERVVLGRETLRLLRTDHHLAIPSGPVALQQLLSAKSPGIPNDAILASVHASPAGTSLPELLELSNRVGLRLQMAKWNREAPIPVPSVVHLRLGHFAAIVSVDGERVLLRDPIFGGDVWTTVEALREESSGYFLVSSGRLPAGFVSASERETATIIGHCGNGYPNHNDDGGDSCGGGGNGNGGDGNRGNNGDGNRGSGGNGNRGNNGNGDRGDGGDGNNGGGGNPPGLPKIPSACSPGMPSYDFHTLHVGLRLFDTPVGYAPPVGPAVYFLLRYNHRDIHQPSTFTYGNVGPKWSHDFLSYVEDTPSNPAQPVTLYPRGGGGLHKYPVYDSPTQTFAPHWRSHAPLVRTSSSPIRYERRLPDGSVEVFGQSDGGIASRRIFMTEVRDALGNALQLTYDGSLRLVAITDAVGQVTTLSYELTSDPLKLTKVTDPFGRYARLTYNAAGHVESITDVVGLTSSFRYGTDSFVSAMITPYGTTTFRNGTSALAYRWLEATDPVGGTERLEYRYTMSEIPNALPSSEVPTGFSAQNTTMGNFNSVYWDKLAWSRYPGDVSKAVITKWMRDTNSVMIDAVKHSEKRPLSGRVWYLYPGQITPTYIGTLVSPSRVGRVLDDGTSQVWETDYNAQGFATATRDPLGRETSFAYAANGIDVTEVRQTTGAVDDLLFSFGTYNGQHLPASSTDTAGQTTTYTYNSRGQMLTATNALSETTTWSYDSNGYLTTRTGHVSGATTTLAYDSYGRVRTTTGSDGYAITADYDLLDRLTTVTYPDGSYSTLTYDRLHVAQARDRAGRISRFFVDPLQRSVLTRDSLGRTVRYVWCTCRTLDAMIDSNAHQTSWQRDVEGRLTKEIRPDTSEVTYTYEAVAGRLKTVTDPKAQVTTFSYAQDNAILQKAFTNEEHVTPDVSWTYDAVYGRLATMVDGLGTTSYTYHPVGQLGAARIASIDGPRSNDTLTYGYDELGRLATRALNSVAVTWTYDALGRVESEINLAGTFIYAYDGATPRLESATYPNGQTTAYTYFGNSGDRRLQTIHHKLAGGATLSRFDYTYDQVGNILTWQQQSDSDPAIVWNYEYDVVGQLLGAVRRTVASPQTILARYGYRYDRAGNRTDEQIDDAVTGATHDTANRVLTHTPAAALRIAGQLSEAASVSIDGVPASVDNSNRFTGTRQLTTGANTFTVTARDAAGNTRSQAYDVDADGASRAFTYDANGNMTSDGTRTFEWDAEDRLLAVVNGSHRSEFSYDGIDRRTDIVEKEAGVVERDAQWFWDGSVAIEERLDTGGISRFFTAAEQHDGVSRYVTYDHLGSVREVTDVTGGIVTRNDYDPYGRSVRIGGSSDSRFGYTGHLAHAASGLYLSLYRAYDPTLGRWLSPDPSGLADGPNLYAYVGNHTIGLRDALGLHWEYSQSTGTLVYIDDTSGARTRVGGGYAGHGPGLNNPSMDHVPNTGPIPQGDWTIGAGRNKPNTGPLSLPLSPAPGTDTHGRSAFYIHGDNSAGNNSASEGCIILPRAVRERMNASPDKSLRVVR